MRVITMTKDET